MNGLNWNHIRAFIAIAEHGSLSAAARAVKGSQPTLGRHVHILERELGVRLFDRTAGGLELTQTGLDLLDQAQTMAQAANRLSLIAEGKSEALAGTIRITASEVVATYVLPGILTKLRRQEPDIQIELVASNRTDNLLKREADIAIRMYRPVQLDVITRKIRDFHIGIYATPHYLAQRGTPRTIADLSAHDIIGYDMNDQVIEGFRAAGFEVERDFFSFRCDDQVACWEMIKAGYGIGFFPIEIARRTDEVEFVKTDYDLPSLPIWLTAHAELKTNRRVRRVFDFLAENI